jgi:hypothetical protein
MSRPDQVEINRWRYWQGQELRSRDFRDQMMSEAQLRWWHNRALHNAFGVRYGLAVTPVILEDPMVAVRVDCGVAYDCFGRELILQSARELPLPPPGSPPVSQILLIRYKDKLGATSARMPGDCATAPEQPEFLWKPSACVEISDGVPLAQLSYDKTKRIFALDPHLTTPVTRPLARPRIGSGATVPEGTAWERWSERVSGANRDFSDVTAGYQVTIDTSAAGFNETPCYFAWLEGTLWQAERSNLAFFPVPLTHIDQASPRQFRFRIWLPSIATLLGARLRRANDQFEEEFINFARRQRLFVCWLGIEPSLAEMAAPDSHTVNED